MTDAQRPLKAVVFGATGAVGKWVVHELLSSSKFSQVVTVTRRYASYPGYESADGKSVHPKLVQVVADYENLSAVADQFNGADAAFCCLGTTRAQAGSAEAFRKVDLDYVVSSAKVSHEKNIKHYSLVSAINADANSMLLYPQTKGEAEEEIKKIGFPQLSIYRPAGLGGLRTLSKISFIFLFTSRLCLKIIFNTRGPHQNRFYHDPREKNNNMSPLFIHLLCTLI
eukprot:TRINITY_DN1359_c0_g2_i1.p1 TRINITY_DN1359_c0_g2~~TRINITY_DN1359_c0_g2_i1.p1  ORF type:complete len:226 (+),score=35.37 TRINITY_DN1359_c0_g2_i1:74-751(+)